MLGGLKVFFLRILKVSGSVFQGSVSFKIQAEVRFSEVWEIQSNFQVRSKSTQKPKNPKVQRLEKLKAIRPKSTKEKGSKAR